MRLRTFCALGRFGVGTFCSPDVLELGPFVLGRFVVGRFVLGRFVLGRFVGAPTMYMHSGYNKAFEMVRARKMVNTCDSTYVMRETHTLN